MIGSAFRPSVVTAKQEAPVTSRLYLDRLRIYLGDRYAERTIAAFLQQSETFLFTIGVKSSYSRADLLRFVDSLVRRGYKPQSINTIVSGVRALFRAMEMPWPLDRRDMHLPLSQDESQGPVLSPEDVARLIAGAPRLGYPALQAVAIASIWGPRNTEIAAILTAGVDGRTLRWQTVKTGRWRQHGIPSTLREILTFRGRTLGRDGVHRLFDTAMRASVREPIAQEGWHAVRRALVSGLNEGGVDSYTLHHYMGWRVAQTGFVYDRRPPEAIDRQVYRLHPFLPLWRKVGDRPGAADR